MNRENNCGTKTILNLQHVMYLMMFMIFFQFVYNP